VAKALDWNESDGEGRKLGERLGLDTPVVLTVNDARLMLHIPSEYAVSQRRR
jgi:hypothetical protein